MSKFFFLEKGEKGEEKMKIECMNILLLGRRDIAKAEDIVLAMKNIGHSVDFLLFPNFHYAEEGNVYKTSLGMRPIRRVKTRIGYYFFHFFSIFYFLFRNFRKKHYDALFAIDWFEGVMLLAFRFFFARGARVIFYGYDFYFFDKKLSSRYGIFCIDRWVARHADEAWVVNETIQKEREKKGVFAKKSKTVPLGITDKKLQYATSNTKHFLFAGNLKEGHNLRFLVGIFANLAKKDKRYELTIAGRGNLSETLAQEIRTQKAEKNIHLRGFVSEADLMREIESGKYAMGIALYENTREITCADPGKVKDYFSWRLPVVMTSYAAISKDVQNYGLGFVVPESEDAFLEFVQPLKEEDLRRKQIKIDAYVKERSFEDVLKKEL